MKSYSSAAFLLCASLGLSANAALNLEALYDMAGGDASNPTMRSQFITLAEINPFNDRIMDEFSYAMALLEQVKNAVGMYADAAAPVPAATVSPSTASASAAYRGSPREVSAAGAVSAHGPSLGTPTPYDDPRLPPFMQLEQALIAMFSEKKTELYAILPEAFQGADYDLIKDYVTSIAYPEEPFSGSQRETFLTQFKTILHEEPPVTAAAAPEHMYGAGYGHGGGGGVAGYGVAATAARKTSPTALPTDRSVAMDAAIDAAFEADIGRAMSVLSGYLDYSHYANAETAKQSVTEYVGFLKRGDLLTALREIAGTSPDVRTSATATPVPLWEEDPTPAVRPASTLTSSDRTLLRELHTAIAALHTEVEAKDGMDVHEANRGVLAPHSTALLDLMRRAKTLKDPEGTQGLQNINAYAETVRHKDLAEIRRVTQTAPRAGISPELGGNDATVLTQAWVLASWCDEVEGAFRFKNALLESIAQNITTGGGCTDGVVGRALIFSAESLFFLMERGKI